MATVRELAVKLNHVNGDTSTLRFSGLSESGTYNLKARLKALNTGTITANESQKTVNYQTYLLSKAGSPAVDIAGGTLTVTESTRVYVQGMEA